MKTCLPAIAALIALGPASATGEDAAAARIFAEARQSCADLDGEFAVRQGARRQVDFGDGAAVALIDEAKFACTAAASLYCGSGGCQLHLISDDEALTFQATGWKVVHWGEDRILLIARDGVWCGGYGVDRCYEAVNRSGGRFLTIRSPD